MVVPTPSNNTGCKHKPHRLYTKDRLDKLLLDKCPPSHPIPSCSLCWLATPCCIGRYRSIRPTNPKIAAALARPGVLALLASVGFAPCVVDSGSGPAAAATPTASSQHPHPAAAAGSDQGGEGEQRLVLPETHSLEACRVAHAAIDIAEQMLGGSGGGGGSSSSNAGNHSSGAGAGSASGDDGGGGKDGEIRASHWCHACGAPIHNDVRPSRWAAQEVGAWRTGGAFGQAGEYRFECKACNVNLCSKCYDGWKGGDGTSTTRPSYRFFK